MKRRRALHSAWIVLFSGFFVGAVAAQESRPSVDPKNPPEREMRQDVGQAVDTLDTVVVTPERAPGLLRLTPRWVDPLEAREAVVDRSPATLPEALRELPGVHVQKTAPGQGSPYIRGFTGFRTVLLIDGVRLNNSTFRDGPNQYWTTVDLLSSERLELVKGPTSVLYGSDAAGGTLGVRTESVDMGEAGGGWDLGNRTYYRYSTAEASHTERVSFSAGYDGVFGFTAGETYRVLGRLDAGGDVGRQDETAYDAFFYDAKMRAKAMEHVEVEFLFQSARLNNVPRTHATIEGVSYHGTAIGSDIERDLDQERELALITAIVTDGTFFEEAEFKLGIHQQRELQDRIRTGARREKAGVDVDQLVSVNQFTTETGIGTLTYGADFYVDFVDSTQVNTNNGAITRLIQGPVADDATYGQFGLFIQDVVECGDWGRLTLGARLTHIDLEADRVRDPQSGNRTSIEDDWTSPVGGAGFLVQATDWLDVYASVNLGFRAPNLSDVSRFDIARSGEIETAAPGLDPEKFLAFEIGPRLHLDRFEAQLAYFYTQLFDVIARRPTGAVVAGAAEVTKANVDDGHIHGIEFQAAWEFVEDFHLAGSFSWIEGTQDDFATSTPAISTEPISKMPPIYGRVALRWQPRDCGFWAEAGVEIVGRQDRLSPGDQRDTQRIPPDGTPGYTVYNLRMGYDIDPRKSVFLHLENLTDKNYRVHGSGSQEAGFNLIVGFDLRF